MYNLIENGPIRWPTKDKHGFSVDEDAQDVVNKLLDKNKSTRLGPNGIEEIFVHPFFKKRIFMQDLLEKKVKAPYIPVIKSSADTSNFDKEV